MVGAAGAPRWCRLSLPGVLMNKRRPKGRLLRGVGHAQVDKDIQDIWQLHYFDAAGRARANFEEKLSQAAPATMPLNSSSPISIRCQRRSSGGGVGAGGFAGSGAFASVLYESVCRRRSFTVTNPRSGFSRDYRRGQTVRVRSAQLGKRGKEGICAIRIILRRSTGVRSPRTGDTARIRRLVGAGMVMLLPQVSEPVAVTEI